MNAQKKRLTIGSKIIEYENKWKSQGYPEGIPDQCPDVLWKQNLAPCWKAVAISILQNDLNFYSLGFSRPKSDWYSFFKQAEFNRKRENSNDL